MSNTKAIRAGILFILAGAGLMVGWVLLRAFAGVYIEGLWFHALGHWETFRHILLMRYVLGTAAFAVTSAFLLANQWVARRQAVIAEDSILGNFEFAPEQADRAVQALVAAACVFAGLAVGVSVGRHWTVFLLYNNAQPFGIEDPVFGMDIGFYLFRLPVIAYLFQLCFILSALAMAVVAVVHFTRSSAGIDTLHAAVNRAFFRHASLLAALAALCVTVRFWVARYNILFAKRGAVAGAGYADIHATLPALGILFWVALLLAAWFVINAYRQRRPGNLYAVTAFAVVWFTLELAWPWAMQSFSVRPNEWSREREYIARSIAFTRAAYGLDKVRVVPWEGDGAVDDEVLDAFSGTLANLPLWHRRPLRDVYNQKQRIRSYYGFSDADVDRYVIGGTLSPVMLSVRELAMGQIPEKSQVWTNLHMQYTHGYGLCLSLAHQIEPGGLPPFLVKDIPPVPHPELLITQPRVYYGERTYNYALTGTKVDEFDYPGDPDNFYNRYDGTGGIHLKSWGRRLLFSWFTGDKDILFTSQFTDETRILLFRDLRSRIGRLAPFLSVDEDPYPVIHEGRIVWIADTYTLSSRYPYSESIGGTNYLRNAVKATVDAYDGTVNLYVADESDPIIRAYRQAFPGLLKPLDEMPAGLRPHLRYPNDLFRIQTLINCRYHVEDPQVFFNGEDTWTFPRGTESDQNEPEQPRYVVMQLPDTPGTEPEFLLTRSFTVEKKDNMIAWMAARCDGPNYGELVEYRLPKSLNIYGPNQARGRFNQDPSISEFTTLMGQLGSTVITSKAQPVPLGGGLMYLQSLYIEDPEVRIPELKQVALAHNDRVVMHPTPEAALDALFHRVNALAATPQPDSGSPAPAESLSGTAAELYRQAREHLQAGDWTAFGKAFDALGNLLPE
jgi:uncharacterized protein